jgi:hypothetical protein
MNISMNIGAGVVANEWSVPLLFACLIRILTRCVGPY